MPPDLLCVDEDAIGNYCDKKLSTFSYTNKITFDWNAEEKIIDSKKHFIVETSKISGSTEEM